MACGDVTGSMAGSATHIWLRIDWFCRDLGHMQVIDALLEARKFEAFNRMSAFVVHDLKNLVTQLSLMLKNAQRHRHNPEFQDDMLMTVDRVVGRMNNLMLQLRTGTTPTEGTSVVDLESIARRVCAAKSNMGVPIELDLTPGIHAMGHYDRLEHVIGHLVQNAIDAVESGGKVAVQLHRDGRTAVIEVADSGAGMSEEFIRERLFKAFETTKASGMGIGVYESSRYIAGIGGRIAIDSKPNEGTRVRVLLPLAEITIASPSESREVA